MFKKLRKRSKRKKVVLKRNDHVRHDWITALLAFFVATLVIIGISTFIFIDTNVAEEPKIPDEEIDNSLIDQELLDETLKYYKEKETLFEEYKNFVPEAPEL